MFYKVIYQKKGETKSDKYAKGNFIGLGLFRAAQKKGARSMRAPAFFFNLFQVESGLDGRFVCEGVPAHRKVFGV